jgi:hypothetical protein
MPLLSDQKKESQIFKALFYPINILIGEALVKGKKDVTRPNVSKHLNVLKYSDTADLHPGGNFRYSFLKEPDGMKKLIPDIRQMSDCSLI